MNLYELTHPIRRGLARLRGRVRSLLLLYGSSRAIVFLVSALVVLFVADYMLRLPLGVRRLTFTLLVGSLAVVLYRRLVAPLRRPLHDATLAARVEERFPLLENRLVSSLAFLDAETDPENSDSPALMRAVVAETADLAPAIKFNEVARSRTPLRWAAGAGAMIIFALLLVTAQPALARTFFERDLLLRDISWPRRTTLAVVDMQPGQVREVTLHHDTLIAVRAEGAIPDRLELRYRERGDNRPPAEIVELSPSAEDPSLFTYNLHVDADYEFTVTGGDDDRADLYRIKALTPPSVVQLELACTYPDYLGREPDVKTDGDQRVPEGTRIELRATVNMELRSAMLVVAGGAPLPMEKTGERSYRAALAPLEDLRYSFLLEGPRGERNEPHTFVLRLSRDNAPDLRVRAPAIRTDRTPSGVLLISFRARDDHRLDAARFRYRIGAAEERVIEMGESEGDAVRFLRGAESNEQLLIGLVAVDVEKLRTADGKVLREDDEITYSIEVVDSAGKQTSTRAGRRAIVVPVNQVEEDIEGRKRDLRESAERTETQASTVGVELLEAASEAPTATPTGGTADDFQRQLSRSLSAMGRLSDQLGIVSGQVRGMLNLYVLNRLDDKATAEQALPYYERHLLAKREKGDAPFRGELYRSLWEGKQKSALRAGGAYLPLMEMADLADRLAADHGPSVYKALRDASRPGVDDGSARGFLRHATEEHAVVENGLRRLRRLMREWQNYEGVVRGLRRLRAAEERIVEELKPREK
ncbi:MAG: hypothetical protein ACYTEG_04160 [Planctomycetota bacterium]